MDLHEVVPGFPTVDKTPNDIDIRRLIAEFSDYAKVIATLLMWNRSSRTPPLGVDFVPLCERRCNKVWALQLFNVSANWILCAW
jgi:hypothetical protein